MSVFKQIDWNSLRRKAWHTGLVLGAAVPALPGVRVGRAGAVAGNHLIVQMIRRKPLLQVRVKDAVSESLDEYPPYRHVVGRRVEHDSPRHVLMGPIAEDVKILDQHPRPAAPENDAVARGANDRGRSFAPRSYVERESRLSAGVDVHLLSPRSAALQQHLIAIVC